MKQQEFTDDLVAQQFPASFTPINFKVLPVDFGSEMLAGLDAHLQKVAGTQFNPNKISIGSFLIRFVDLGPIGGIQAVFLEPSRQRVFISTPALWTIGWPYSVITGELVALEQGQRGTPLRTDS